MTGRARSLLAAATGAALLLTGTGVPSAQAGTRYGQVSTVPDFTGEVQAVAYVPAHADAEARATLKLRDPATVERVTGWIVPPGKQRRRVTFDLRPGSATVTGKWTVAPGDPAGAWRLTAEVTRGGAPRANDLTVQVAARQAITGATVSPSPVKLVRGKDVKVSVEVKVKGSETVTAKLVAESSTAYYDLGTLARESNGVHRGVTYFGDHSPPGEWTLQVHATRGGETLRSLLSFTVTKPAAGTPAKAGARVTVGVPKRVGKGRWFRVHGKVYRDGRPYKRKKVRIYFKAVGAAKYRLAGYATTNSTGRYTRSFKARKDGYYQVKSAGTSRTSAALSPQRLVDVR
ncbi:hypothetical protein [Nonomuraea sp. C10]|uniref:hypothetical protein n=1 Tax=Nonomuraea sp. C10 TaxID=2600577 RepID=UPI0011CD98B4|nr:hypothetical protein [Nonomuraea sp. C10]TXK43125.1 hypothetical protein FR742_29285 [Nonomuraea sp. C10]